jgi:hypothetical protein
VEHIINESQLKTNFLVKDMIEQNIEHLTKKSIWCLFGQLHGVFVIALLVGLYATFVMKKNYINTCIIILTQLSTSIDLKVKKYNYRYASLVSEVKYS